MATERSREILDGSNIIDSIKYSEPLALTPDEVLSRGVANLLPDALSLKEIMEEKRIKLYLGIDATSPNLHIGHTVPLRKLRQFQELGHEVVLLFGGFTSLIGDPSDKSAARVRLTPEQVALNMATYVEQAGKILDTSPEAPNPIQIVNNNEWLSVMRFAEIVDLASNFSLQQIEQRDMFKTRREEGKPIWMHELMYLLMQGQDANHLDVDLEVGGNDQLFNMLAGQTLVRRYREHEKWVLGTKLIEDTTGKKMGKTEGNVVNLRDWPEWKYEALMSWPDATIGVALELLTNVPMQHVDWINENLAGILSGELGIHPMHLKEAVAYRIVAELDGSQAADYAEQEFNNVVRNKGVPQRVVEVKIDTGTSLKEALVRAGLAANEEEAGFRLKEGAIYIDGKKHTGKASTLSSGEYIVKIGSRALRQTRKLIVG